MERTFNKLIIDKSGVGIGQMIHFFSSFIYNCRKGVRFSILVQHLDTWTQSVKIIQDKIMGISPRTWHWAGVAWNDQSSEQKLPAAEDEQPETFRAPASDPERQIGGKNIDKWFDYELRIHGLIRVHGIFKQDKYLHLGWWSCVIFRVVNWRPKRIRWQPEIILTGGPERPDGLTLTW